MIEAIKKILQKNKFKSKKLDYRGYVGPAKEYDLISAMVFNLLTSCGLREHHILLDIGCGSLRNGRLFIPYLNPSNYIGIEPNSWLVDDGIKKETGKEQISIKRPNFIFAETISKEKIFKKVPRVDYILLQSIFSHMGKDLMEKTFLDISAIMDNNTHCFATFVLEESDRYETKEKKRKEGISSKG